MKSILCAGEALYDFISTSVGAGLAGSALFEKRAGGSPFNVAVGISRLGLPAALLVKVGTDEFGAALHNLMIAENLDPRFIVLGKNNNTTLAMTAINKAGNPEFRFYRDNAADISLTMQEVPIISPEEISLFHFGSISLVEEPAASTYVKVFRSLKKDGVLTSLDPNIRPLYAEGKESYIKLIRTLLNKVDILKMSNDDLRWLTGKDTVEKGISALPYNKAGILIITEGANGAQALWRDEVIRAHGFPVTVADTAGCGDSFMAGFLARFMILTEGDFKSITPEILRDSIRYANACAAIVATRFGAASSMPKPQEVSDFMLKRA